jgi:hypothetical protein
MQVEERAAALSGARSAASGPRLDLESAGGQSAVERSEVKRP